MCRALRIFLDDVAGWVVISVVAVLGVALCFSPIAIVVLASLGVVSWWWMLATVVAFATGVVFLGAVLFGYVANQAASAFDEIQNR